MLKGDDCLPSGDDELVVVEQQQREDEREGSGRRFVLFFVEARAPSTSSSSPDSSTPRRPKGSTPYDKDAVEAQLKRAARQVKSGCGSASDDEGQRTGPWGSTKASVVLGRNGHVKQVTVPSPYDGKPVGVCVINAFKKIQFPPYAGSSDVVIDWDIEIVQPKK